MRETDDSYLIHQGMIEKGLFEGSWTHIHSSANDEILFSPGDEEIALFIQVAQIAGIKPLLGVASYRIAKVAFHLKGRSNLNKAAFAESKSSPFFVDGL